jgi:hypothetical protein
MYFIFPKPKGIVLGISSGDSWWALHDGLHAALPALPIIC